MVGLRESSQHRVASVHLCLAELCVATSQSLLQGGLSSLLVIDNVELRLEVLGGGCRTTDALVSLAEGSAVAFEADGDFVKSIQDLEGHFLLEHSEALGLKRDVDVVLGIRKQFAPDWNCLEVGHFAKCKVQGQVLVLVAHGQNHVAAVVGRAFAELQQLLVQLNVRIHGAGHHLHLQVLVLDTLAVLAKTHYSKGCVLLGSNLELRGFGQILDVGLNRAGAAWFAAIAGEVRKALLTFVFLCAADELDGNLLVRPDRAVEGEGCEDALSHFLAYLGGRDKVLLLAGTVFVLKVAEALQEVELEAGGLRAVINQESGVLPALAHVNCPEVEAALNAAAFVENNRKGLLDARCAHLHDLEIPLPSTLDPHPLDD